MELAGEIDSIFSYCCTLARLLQAAVSRTAGVRDVLKAVKNIIDSEGNDAQHLDKLLLQPRDSFVKTLESIRHVESSYR